MLTKFVTNALNSRSKVQGFLHCKHGQMQVILVHIGCSVHCSELVKALAIVRDVTSHLQKM